MALDAIIHRKRHSWWSQLQQAPVSTLARTLYTQRQGIIGSRPASKKRCGITAICVSDTHNRHPDLPPGDLLIHAGDLTQGGTIEELQAQLDWLNAQPHMHKVVIAGNHDIVLDENKSVEFGMPRAYRKRLRWGSITYLEHSAATLSFPNGIRLSVFGHPETPRQGNWAFQYDRCIDAFTNRINDNIDILVTHSAPRFHLDVAAWGDAFLLRELWRIKPMLHVFGHIHGGRGQDILVYDRFEDIYERICARSAGISGLFYMALLLLLQMLFQRPYQTAEQTLLVNASIVGGRSDQECRAAHIIHL